MLKKIPQENLKTNFYITNPDTSNIEQIIRLYKDNRDVLGIPFNRVFDQILGDKTFAVIVLQDNTVAGFCGFKYKPRKQYYEIEHLCVDKKFRNNHFAIILLKHHLENNYRPIIRQKLFVQSQRVPIVAYAVEGAENNSFYDRFSTRFDVVPKKTKVLREYFLDADRILNYGS